MSAIIKICGLSEPGTLRMAMDAGADWVGFVFHPRSPRYVTPEKAAVLAATARGRTKIVALLVDPDDALLATVTAAIKPDFLQLHGQETPSRCAAIRAACALPLVKAIGVSTAADLAPIADHAAVPAHILLDAKPPRDAAYPGGHGQPFNWAILAALPKSQPFILSGGLTPENVAGAIRAVRAMGLNLAGVDVSSGVESAPGVKDGQKIQSFVANARRALNE